MIFLPTGYLLLDDAVLLLAEVLCEGKLPELSTQEQDALKIDAFRDTELNDQVDEKIQAEIRSARAKGISGDAFNNLLEDLAEKSLAAKRSAEMKFDDNAFKSLKSRAKKKTAARNIQIQKARTLLCQTFFDETNSEFIKRLKHGRIEEIPAETWALQKANKIFADAATLSARLEKGGQFKPPDSYEIVHADWFDKLCESMNPKAYKMAQLLMNYPSLDVIDDAQLIYMLEAHGDMKTEGFHLSGPYLEDKAAVTAWLKDHWPADRLGTNPSPTKLKNMATFLRPPGQTGGNRPQKYMDENRDE